MSTQNSSSEKNVYTGRFADRSAPAKRSAPTAPRKQPDAQTRRPSGFAAASGKTPKKNVSSRPTEKAAPSKQKSSEKKQPTVRPPKPKAKKHNFKPLLILIALAAIIYLLIALIFGGESKTYHQLPTVERESIASFEPEATALTATEAP